MDSDSRDWLYRRYVATSLKIIKEPDKAMAYSLDELLNPTPTEKRTAEEIIDDVCEKTGITFID